jgi:hypothetical protein
MQSSSSQVPPHRVGKQAVSLETFPLHSERFPCLECPPHGLDQPQQLPAGAPPRFLRRLAKMSSSRIVVPSTGHWYVSVDLAGLRASDVRASVNVQLGALPTLRSANGSLSGIRSEPPVRPVPDESGQTWDAFISHAGEDKASIALPLYDALTERGLKVWLDKGELRIGDSLRRKIDYGLAHSSFGVVVFSKSFFATGWPQYELDGIVGLSVASIQRMLPIWHENSRTRWCLSRRHSLTKLHARRRPAPSLRSSTRSSRLCAMPTLLEQPSRPVSSTH